MHWAALHFTPKRQRVGKITPSCWRFEFSSGSIACRMACLIGLRPTIFYLGNRQHCPAKSLDKIAPQE